MFTILRKITNDVQDELLEVATIDDRTAAEKLVHSLNEFWPAEYIIRDSESEPSEPMAPKQHPPLTAGKMHSQSFCDYCNVNKLDPNDEYYLPNEMKYVKTVL
jgi:hypothetical protein